MSKTNNISFLEQLNLNNQGIKNIYDKNHQNIKSSNRTNNYAQSKSFFLSNDIYKRTSGKFSIGPVSSTDITVNTFLPSKNNKLYQIGKSCASSLKASGKGRGGQSPRIYLSSAPSQNPLDKKNINWLKSLSFSQRRQLVSQSIWIKNMDWLMSIKQSLDHHKLDSFSQITKAISQDNISLLPLLISMSSSDSIAQGLDFALTQRSVDIRSDLMGLFLPHIKTSHINKMLLSYVKDKSATSLSIDDDTHIKIGELLKYSDKYYVCRQLIYQKNAFAADVLLSSKHIDMDLLEEMVDFAIKKRVDIPQSKARFDNHHLREQLSEIVEQKEARERRKI